MAEVKYQFKGMSRFNATLLFTALASSAWGSFLTTGLMGKFVFFILEKIGNWIANQGLALANIGIDEIKIMAEKDNFESVMDEAVKEVQNKKGRLTDAEKKKIDNRVKSAFRRFATFVD